MRPIGIALLALISPAASAPQLPNAPAAPIVRGVVTTTNNVPLARVRVAVVSASTSEPGVLTDARGEFALRVPDAESVRLSFTKARYETVTLEVRRSQLTAADLVRARLSLGGAISGQVRDRSGVPVMQVPVIARRGSTPATDSPVLTVTTDDRGEFRFGGLTAGPYVLSARGPAVFNPVSAKAAAAPQPPDEQMVNVSLGEEVAGIDITIDVPSQLARRGGGVTPSDPDARTALRGRVVTPGGTPIARAVVQAYGPAGATPAVESDDRGLYTITGLAPGDYRVQAFKHGFITPRDGLGQNAVEILLLNSPPAQRFIPLRRDQTVDAVDVTLFRGGVITGTIVDEFGEPMQGVAVNALELRMMGGRTRALRASTGAGHAGRTDDRGRYRLFGLEPGTYVVQAVASDLLSATVGYVALFYPGTPTIEQAVPTKLDDDAVVAGVDLTLTPGPAHRIRGTVLDPVGNPASVALTLTVSERSGAIQTEPITARAEADGTFAFNNIAPGDYVVQATATGRTGPSAAVAVARQFATAFVTVSADGPPPLQLKLSLGATLMGRVVYEGMAPPPPYSGVTLVAVPADFDRAPLLGTGATGFALLSDKTFEYRGVFGPTFLTAQANSGYVKSITFKGQDLSDTAFDFGSTETFRDVEVVVSGDAASLSGVVTDDRAAAVRDFTVVLFPVDRTRWTIRSRWVKTARSTQEGMFRLTGLVPGDYWVAAVDRLDGTAVAGDLQNPQVLDALAARALRVTLGGGQSQDVTLRLLRR